MAKGTRGKKGAPTQSSAPVNSNNENSDTNNLNKAQNRDQPPRQQRIRKNKEVTRDEDPKANHIEEHESNSQPQKTEKVSVQATSEQLMLAGLTANQDDPNQKTKITLVMEITGKGEDAVATALFDAGWDQNRAVELLLEGGADTMGEWEETGKKKKKKAAGTEDKDDWDEEVPESRDRGGPKQKGPPRLRRGGGPGGRGQGRERGGDREAEFSGPKRGSDSSRRGGRGGAPGGRGGRSFNNAGQSGNASASAGADRSSSKDAGGFAGSIDTWSPPGGGQSAAAGSGEGEERSSRSRKSNKDAFENAGNWGDDFPAPEDWDNEEYTGSLADTKVFTNKKTVGESRSSKQQPDQSEKRGKMPQQGLVGNSSNSNAYGPQIDLSTLLSKPSTQSAIGSSSQAAPTSLLQFSSQNATDTLKSVVGISSGSSNGKGNDLSYPSYAAASNQHFGRGSGNNEIMPQRSSQPTKEGGAPAPQGGRSRLQGSSKIPSSAVEMPGDSFGSRSGGLDVQFGGLSLQFGDTVNSDSNSGFDFNGSSGPGDDKYLSGDKKTSVAPPSAKEVNKTLSNTLTGGKLNSSDVYDNRKSGTATGGYPNARGSGANLDPKGEIGGYSSSTYGGRQQSQQQPQQPQTQQSYGGNQYGQSQSGYTNGNSYSSQQGSYAKDNNAGNYSGYGSQGSRGTAAPGATTAGLGSLTTTTNALSGKVSATSASKMGMPSIQPGVAGLMPQYMPMHNPSMAMYGFPAQANVYSPYTAMDDIAAMQRNAGIHTLVGSAAASQHMQQQASRQQQKSSSGVVSSSSGAYYDPHFQNATSNSASGSMNRSDSTVTSSSGSGNQFGDASNASSKSNNFGSASLTDSTSSPITSTLQPSGQPTAQPAFNLGAPFANPAAAGQTIPPGYAYFYGHPSMASYGATTGLYPQMAGVPSAAGTATTQFQQKSYNTNYGSYDHLAQSQGNKEFSSGYSAVGGKNASGNNAASGNAGNAKGHQYWSNSPLTSNQLW